MYRSVITLGGEIRLSAYSAIITFMAIRDCVVYALIRT